MNKILFGISVGMLAGVCVAQIPMSQYVRTFTSSVRGCYVQAPVDFTVTHLQVPDELNQGTYNVAIYRMTASPPAFPRTFAVTALAHGKAIQSGNKFKLPNPVTFKKGEWFGVLGAAGTQSSNSYGTRGGTASSILGLPVTLNRFLMQTSIVTNGNGRGSSDDAGPIGRVRVYITKGPFSCSFCPGSNGKAALSLCDTNPAIIGKRLGITMNSGGTTNTGGLLAVALLRGNTNIPGFGRVCFQGLVTVIPFGTGAIAPGRGTKQLFPVPNTAALLGGSVRLQGALVTALAAPPLTNGFEITFGN